MEKNSILFEKARELFNKSSKLFEKTRLLFYQLDGFGYMDANKHDYDDLSNDINKANIIRKEGRTFYFEIIKIIELNDNDPIILNSDEAVSTIREKLNLVIEKFNESIKNFEFLSETMTEFLENVRPSSESRNKYKKKYLELKNYMKNFNFL